MRFLAINEGFDSSIAILEDGRITFALQEERVRRSKNYFGFPNESLRFSLDYLGLSPQDFDGVCLSNLVSPSGESKNFYDVYEAIAELPNQNLYKRLSFKLKNQIAWNMPRFIKGPYQQKKADHKNNLIQKRLEESGFGQHQIYRSSHHLNHAATAYFGLRKNSTEPHLVLTLDGGGDRVCSQVYLADKGKLTLLAETEDGHSVGNIYSRVTHLMGMKPHEHEYKIMGLAAYHSNDKYVRAVVEKFEKYLDLDPENPLQFKSKIPEKTYAIQARLAADFRRVRFDNLAAGLQLFTEELMLKWVKAVVKKVGVRNVVVSGGVFMNIKANKRISELEEIDYFNVFPSCGDETLPFGSAWHHYAKLKPAQQNEIVFDSFYLGPEPDYDIKDSIQTYSDRLDFKKLENPEFETAKLLQEGNIVARCSGRMEFGARALGNRSILADPAKTEVVPEINKMIKQRDFWMPFAPAMIQEECTKYIKIPKSLMKNKTSPYMMHSFDTTEKANQFIAGVHAYDKTARAQVVLKELNPSFHKLISEFSKLSGKSVVLNTSFNLHGFPIVMSSKDAIEVLLQSSLKYLVVNDYLITKKDNRNA